MATREKARENLKRLQPNERQALMEFTPQP
jgi:hypothetical protein